MTGSDVVAIARMGKGSLEIIRELIPEAVQIAMVKARERIIQAEMGAESPVPIDTGRLRSSFMVSFTPASIAMRWSAIKPDGKGYDYADIVNQRQPYSEKMKEIARRIVYEELLAALKMLFAGVTI